MNNKYYFRSRISERQFRLILRLFCLDIEAKKVAEFTGLNRGTINNIYNKLRKRIA
ncbi:MAG: IS1595 family transposase, partial [Prevotellaceae bacterium]|nr:IS1595 family transposase [Prevotellaceae bacterium]